MQKIAKILVMFVFYSISMHAIAIKSIKSLPIEFISSDEASYDRAIDLNRASLGELAKLKGMSKERAEAIVNYRKQHGNFNSFYELSRVDGFKNLKEGDLKRIEGQLKIG